MNQPNKMHFLLFRHLLNAASVSFLVTKVGSVMDVVNATFFAVIAMADA